MSSRHIENCFSKSIADCIVEELKKDSRRNVIINACINPIIDHTLDRLKPYILYTAFIFASTVVFLIVLLIYISSINNSKIKLIHN